MAIIFLCFLCAASLILCTVHGNLNILCNDKDRIELSLFKQGIKDPSKKLASWSTEPDCCNWEGVECDNVTGRVTKLDLHCPTGDTQCLEGKIDLSVLKLKFLSFFDLSSNDFELVHGSGNMSSASLVYMDLSMNYNLHMEDLEWVSRLSSMEYLNLSGISLGHEALWLQRMDGLTSLVELRLSGCSLNGNNPTNGYVVNLTSLAVLDVSNNSFNYEVMPKWLFSLTNNSIYYLDISSNNLGGQIPSQMVNFRNLNSLIMRNNRLEGPIPEWISQFKHLEQLDLSNNSFSGPIPSTIGNLSSLISLDVSFNSLNGSLPRDFWILSKLESLSLGYNSFSGIISEGSFANLSNLKSLSMDATSFTFDLSSRWHPPFQLEMISLSGCSLGPDFPPWLYSQRSLSYLDFSSSGLAFNAQQDFWTFVSQIDHLLLSDNKIGGNISSVVINSTMVDLKWNSFSGGLPRLAPKVQYFNIANNSLSGLISPLSCSITTGEKTKLEVLDMSHNLLSGDLTKCWSNWQSLLHLNLGSNGLTGEIPDSIGSLIKLQTFRVRNNSLFGTIPLSLKGCKSLWYLDLGFNEFTGNLPAWFSPLSLAILLRSNKLNGSIPLQTCQLSNLLVLDLANNSLKGEIPKCLYKINAMVTYTVDKAMFNSYFRPWNSAPISVRSHLEDLPLFVKGQQLNYWHALKLVRIIDLSSNDLSGLIPPEMFGLIALQSLDLSHNRLFGKIPSEIQQMRFLESLDLSRNFFSGEIPQGMSKLSFLSYLNLSYNNFYGRIPLGTQLQSFDARSYMGNPQLCGAPLAVNCTQEEGTVWFGSMEHDDGDDFRPWFVMGMGVGFVSAFCCVCGTLFLVKRWRFAYFQFLKDFTSSFS